MSELLHFILHHEEAFKSRNRLASLYADFRLQLSTNPDGYHANITAWKQALASAARAGVIPSTGNIHNLLSIRTSEDLLRALQHPTFGRPTCLPAVFHDAVQKGVFMPKDEFLKRRESIYHKGWPIPTPWGVLKWGLKVVGLVGEPGFSEKMGVGEFVVLGNVEGAATEVLKRMDLQATFTVDRILSRSDFLNRFSNCLAPGTQLSASDLDILLVHLARDRQGVSYSGETIKFKAVGEALPSPITQEDVAIANLRDTIAKIHAQIPPIEARIAETDAAAREAVKKGQTVQAKAALRKKKLAESALQQHTDVTLQLEGVYAQLQQAADQVEIVEAMKQGAAALKGLHEKVGGAEGVAGVVDALREEMDTADEITNIINESGQPVDEGEIEDEFEALEKAEKEKKEREEAEKKAEAEARRFAEQMKELEKVERERREGELMERSMLREKERDERKVSETSQEMAKLSVDEDSIMEDVADEQERVPLPA